jgi:hypothetical protein
MLFSGRKLVIATMHNKQQVIGPILEEFLQVKTFLPEKFNSDQFGTFSGEIERVKNPIVTAKEKCLMAMEISGCGLAVSSEGSFGPHPAFFYVHANEEIIYFFDQENGLEIVAREISTDTNFNASWINNKQELKLFAENALFPSHGLILRNGKDGIESIDKGIINSLVLFDLFDTYLERYDGAYVETDMRANFNPTRMEVIKKVALKLVDLLHAQCPNCHTVGFDVVESKTGLPCSLCSSPTRSTLAHIYQCKKCKHQEYKTNPQNKQTEDPMYCDRCNP